MKKSVGLLAALALCVTVGGVYATWNYQENTYKVKANPQTVGLTDVGTLTEEKLEVTKNNLSFRIDDTDNDHIGDKVVSEGEITVTYTPGAYNQETIKITCTITIDGNHYAVTDTTLTYANYALNGRVIIWTISASEFNIDVGSEKVNLPTKADYDAFVMSDTITLTFESAIV